ncbi:hypothetical protein AAFF_G00220690 [Aldrovandia affinis]|uniref:Uncharacterized protein n=1 Tax=Aldrovandia affinis TaxID=143900 RepID=A0AAD7W4T8_9TELE|nr:hypothetical protein AAFF_G00220690 [Aldrovandia affinis]
MSTTRCLGPCSRTRTGRRATGLQWATVRVVADEHITRRSQAWGHLGRRDAVLSRGDWGKDPGAVQQGGTLHSSRPGVRRVGHELTGNPQWLPVDQLRRGGLEVFLGGRPESKHDPREFVKPVAVLQAGSEGGFHGPMKTLTQSVGLRVVGGGTVEFNPKPSATALHSSEVNCGPRSEERSDGVPNRTTHAPMNARARSADVVEERGLPPASGSSCPPW